MYEDTHGGRTGKHIDGFGYYQDLQNQPITINSITDALRQSKEYDPYLNNFSSAMEKGEAFDFKLNTGKDARIYAYQEYLRKSDPQNTTGWADADMKWKDRRNPQDFDNLYNSSIGQLPQNQRRIAINNGRDWYYKNTFTDKNGQEGIPGVDYWSKTKNPEQNKQYQFDNKTGYYYNRGEDGSLSPAYGKTWYGRIWNTNDYKDFDPNNPKFTPPQKANGGNVDSSVIPVKDNRTTNPVTGLPINPNRDLKTGNYDRDVINSVIGASKHYGVNPYNALAVGLQETGLSPDETGHVKDYRSDMLGLSEDELNNLSDVDKNAYLLAYAMKRKEAVAKNLGHNGDVWNLQAYNGFGKIGTQTEKSYHNEQGVNTNSFYGVDVTKHPLDLAKNPAYGKTVLSLAEMLKQNKAIDFLVEPSFDKIPEQYQPVPFTQKKANGGMVDKYGNPIDSKMANVDEPRTHYNHDLDLIKLGNDYRSKSPQEQADILAHENFHSKQFRDDKYSYKDNFDAPYKRPSLVNTDEIKYNYYNRKGIEIGSDIENFKNQNPDFRTVPDDLIYDSIIDNQQYNNPYSLEGGADYYMKTGNLPPQYKNGGTIGLDLFANGGSVYDYLESKGEDGSYQSRKKIYGNLFSEGYTGTAQQNIKLLGMLKSGEVGINEAPTQQEPTQQEQPTQTAPATTTRNIPTQQAKAIQENYVDRIHSIIPTTIFDANQPVVNRTVSKPVVQQQQAVRVTPTRQEQIAKQVAPQHQEESITDKYGRFISDAISGVSSMWDRYNQHEAPTQNRPQVRQAVQQQKPVQKQQNPVQQQRILQNIEDPRSQYVASSSDDSLLNKSRVESNISKKVIAPSENNPFTNVTKINDGLITDKRTNQSYVIKNGEVVSRFNVLTGQNPDYNPSEEYSMDYLDAHPEARGTPVGSYFMQPNSDIYGYKGFDLNPIEVNGQKPKAKNTAIHVTYPKEEAYRNQFYGTNQANKTYGCTNCQKPSIDLLYNNFPKGDTNVVVDSKIDPYFLSAFAHK